MTTPQPLVSVTIASYNHERYVEETLRSVMAQSYPNLELILVDDGSLDATFQKIKTMEPELRKRFVRVSLRTRPNQGTCRTLNELFTQAQGKYIALIASDDRYLPTAIERLVAVMEAPDSQDVVLAVGDNAIIDGEGRRCFWDKGQNCVYQEEKAHTRTFCECLFRDPPNCVLNLPRDFGKYSTLVRFGNHVPNGYLLRRSALQAIGPFTPEAPLEDYWQNLRLATIGRFRWVPEVLFEYRWHSANSVKRSVWFQKVIYQTRRYEFRRLVHLPECEQTRIGLGVETRRYLLGSPRSPIALWRTPAFRAGACLVIGKHAFALYPPLKFRNMALSVLRMLHLGPFKR